MFEAALEIDGEANHDRHHHGVRGDARPRQMDERALWLWGRLLDFERQHILDADLPHDLLDQMFDHMQEATLQLAPIVAKWLRRINDER